MKLSEYVAFTRQTKIYPDRYDGDSRLAYTVLGAQSEIAELEPYLEAAVSGGNITPETLTSLAAELGDVAWYWARIADDQAFGVDTILSMPGSKLPPGVGANWDIERISETLRFSDKSRARFGFPLNFNLAFMDLQGSFGRIAGLSKRMIRDNQEPNRPALAQHLCSAFIALNDFASIFNLKLDTIFQHNRDKLLDRKARGTVSGEGDHR